MLAVYDCTTTMIAIYNYSDVIAIYKPPVCRLLELNYPVFMVLSLCIWLMLSFSKTSFFALSLLLLCCEVMLFRPGQ